MAELNFGSKSRPMLALMWTVSLLMLPLLLWQGYRTRQKAMRFPEAAAPDAGQFGENEPQISLIGLGDSVIAGVGVDKLSDALVAQVARRLANRSGKAVSWQARGGNGDKLADLLLSINEQTPAKADIYLISVGVNDVTGLTPLIRWQMQVIDLITLLDQRATILFLGVPPMQYFTALPQPLRWVLGIRAALLDKTLRQFAETVERIIWCDASSSFQTSHLAADGYHPNGQACLEIAGQIVDALPLAELEAKP